MILLSFPILNNRLDGWTRWDLGELLYLYKIPPEKTLHLEYMLHHLSMLEVENDDLWMTLWLVDFNGQNSWASHVICNFFNDEKLHEMEMESTACLKYNNVIFKQEVLQLRCYTPKKGPRLEFQMTFQRRLFTGHLVQLQARLVNVMSLNEVTTSIFNYVWK